MKIKYFLIDFCNTLSNSLYFIDLPINIRNKINLLLFNSNNESNEIDDKWMTGKLNHLDVLKYLSESIPFSLNKLKESLYFSAKQFKMNKNIYNALNLLKKNNINLACVTINTDIFNKITIEDLKLNTCFDFIINSYDYNTSNKNELCNIAIEKMNNKVNISECILIDDNIKNINNFNKIGGQTYHYTCDKKFKKWFDSIKSQHNWT
jgi:FMN phosphatase YigB (HAD superfamily)